MISVLRLGHRRTRDQRMTTHVALVSRAFGADEITIAGDEDGALEKSVRSVAENWGGSFRITHTDRWVEKLREAKGSGACVVHLTMYGEKVGDRIDEIRKRKNCVVIVGSQKVPPEAYQLADYNVSVTTQPHSEIAALAIFLDRYFEGRELQREFGGKLKILPSKIGKNVLSCGQ